MLSKNFLDGLNIFKGAVTYKAIADDLNYDYYEDNQYGGKFKIRDPILPDYELKEEDYFTIQFPQTDYEIFDIGSKRSFSFYPCGALRQNNIGKMDAEVEEIGWEAASSIRGFSLAVDSNSTCPR